MTTVSHLLQRSVDRAADAVLVHHRGQDWTYGQVFERARAIAGWLDRHGLQPGERVGMLVPNSAEYICCYFAVLMAGGIVVALNPDTTTRELTQTLVHCRPAALVAVPKCFAALETVAESLTDVRMTLSLDAADEFPRSVAGVHASLFEAAQHAPLDCQDWARDRCQVAQIIYTSGTTGKPKGVTLTHRNLLVNCASIVQYLKLDMPDSAFVVLPFFYSYGNSLLITHVAVGGRLVLATDFVFWNRALDLMESQRVTGFSGVPSTYAMLLHKSDFSKRRFRDLRYLTCAGGAMPPATVSRIRSLLPHVQIYPMYGQTEATARLSSLLPEDVDRKRGSIGRGIPGVRLAVLSDTGQPVAVGEVGEIVAQGENVMLGYWQDPEATRDVLRPEGLWTGDLARVDEDGYIFITGRRSDMIKSGAYRVHPQEIEEVVAELEGVAEVAATSRPDPIQGELPVVFVIRDVTHQALTEEQVLQHCRAVLPRYKQPQEIRFTSDLPKTTSGKVKRHELRQRLLGGP